MYSLSRFSFDILSCLQSIVKYFFQVFSIVFDIFKAKRRRRDLNPCAAINDLLPFQGSPFGQLGYFSIVARIAFYIILYYHMIFSCDERRGWDSNPRALADKRFSRPPRYDHFDTSPGQRRLSFPHRHIWYDTSISSVCQQEISLFFKKVFTMVKTT